MQARTSGEVGVLGTVLLRFIRGQKTFAIFIEIGLYLREKAKDKLAQFF